MQWEEVGPLNHIAGISGTTVCQHRGPRLKLLPQGPWRRTALQLCVEEVGPLNHMLELLETQYASTRAQTLPKEPAARWRRISVCNINDLVGGSGPVKPYCMLPPNKEPGSKSLLKDPGARIGWRGNQVCSGMGDFTGQ